MDSPKKRRKRGTYKKYLNPGAEFKIPRSTLDSQSRLEQRKDASDVEQECDSDGSDQHGVDLDAPADDIAPGIQTSDAENSYEPHNREASTAADSPPMADGRPGAEWNGFEGDYEYSNYSSSCSDCSSNEEQDDISELDVNDPGSGASHPEIAGLFKGVLSQKLVVSKGDILLMVLKYALRMNLSFTGLASLVEMINSFFDSPVLPSSKYFVNKLLGGQGPLMTFHFFCPECTVYVGEGRPGTSLECPECKKVCGSSALSDAPFFVLFDIPSQLQKLLKGCEFLDLTEPLEFDGTLSDMKDGSMYQNFVAATRDAGHRISFSWNTDGTPVFRSSRTSIWPIQLLVNEVPIAERMRKVVLAGLWFGKEKPHMGIFQAPFVEAMNSLADEGFPLLHKGKEKVFRAFCICCAVDSVARAPMQGIKQFNAYYGCNWCLHPGDNLGGRVVKYPVKQHAVERTEKQMVEDMEKVAMQDKPKPIHGVITVSPLINMPQFHIVWSFVPDYMHCVLLGVVRQFLDLWLESAGKTFYVGRSQSAIDSKLMAIAPPKDVRRAPRPTKEKRFWKAKECENWLLFYCLPVLEGILGRQYLQHWACLVEALHVMLGPSVSFADLAVVEGLLLDFHGNAEILYGPECMTYNMHQLLHLGKSVRHWGPLWAHSAFPFEAGNGTLKAAVKASNGIACQIGRMLQIDTVVEQCAELSTSQNALQYCASLAKTLTKKSVSTPEGARFLGRGSPYIAPNCTVKNAELVSGSCTEYSRICLNGSIVTKRAYAQGKKTDSSVVQLVDGTFAVVQKIVLSNGSGFVLVHRMKCRKLRFPSVEMRHLLKVVYICNHLDVLPLSSIKTLGIFMELDSSFVSPIPSSYTL